MAEDSEPENWYKAGVQFECTACGKCCMVPQGAPAGVAQLSFPGASLDDEEVSVVAAHIGLTDAHFRERYVAFSRAGFQALAVIDGACVFYDKETKLCKVHEARPSSCRAFPFWWNIEAKLFWESYKAHCEGIGQGPLISEAEILHKLRTRKPNVYPDGSGICKPLPQIPDVPAVLTGDPQVDDD